MEKKEDKEEKIIITPKLAEDLTFKSSFFMGTGKIAIVGIIIGFLVMFSSGWNTLIGIGIMALCGGYIILRVKLQERRSIKKKIK